MKVLMLGRLELFSKGGGDKIQIDNTARELRNLGVEVDIRSGYDFNPKEYDLVHVFQLDWTPETYLYAKEIKKAHKPFVLSPIHHSVAEVQKFDDEYVFDFRRVSRLLFKDQFKRDTFKNVYRSFAQPKKISPTIYSMFYGFKKMLKETLEMSDYVLVQTTIEAHDLEGTFGVPIKWVKVPNGVSEVFISETTFKNPLDFEDYILCVGRIEPRKNQLKIIEAVSMLRHATGKDIKLVLIGSMNDLKHFEYTARFSNELKKNDWIKHIKYVDYRNMPQYYHFAKVCVSASWFETTGLTSLEALFCGTNAVATGARAKEYLNENASYCAPENVDSIKEALLHEFDAPRPKVDPKLKEEYTWKTAAKKTLEVYDILLKEYKSQL